MTDRPRWKGPEDPLLRWASIGLMAIGLFHIGIGLVLILR